MYLLESRVSHKIVADNRVPWSEHDEVLETNIIVVSTIKLRCIHNEIFLVNDILRKISF